MAKLQLFPRPGLVERVSMTQLRPHLREVVEAVHGEGCKFLITYHGRPVAAMVSIRDFWRIWEDEELDLMGPKDPKTGKRPGGVWVERNGWQRHMAVRWTEDGPVVEKRRLAELPGEEEGEVVVEKTPERRGWWRFW